jgi:integrase
MNQTFDRIEKHLYRRLYQTAARLTIHSFRHSFASALLMNGTTDVEVSAILGHADVYTTKKVYSQFIPKMGMDAAANLGALIFGAKDSVVHQSPLRRKTQLTNK